MSEEKQWQNLFLQVKFSCSLKVQKPFLNLGGVQHFTKSISSYWEDTNPDSWLHQFVEFARMYG